MEENKIRVEVRIQGSAEDLEKVLKAITRELRSKMNEDVDLLVIGECR